MFPYLHANTSLYTGLPICAFEQGTVCLTRLTFVSANSTFSAFEILFILYHFWSVYEFVYVAAGPCFIHSCVKAVVLQSVSEAAAQVFSQKPEESQRSNTIKSPLSLFYSRQFLSLMSLHCFIVSASIISDFGYIPAVHSHRPYVQCVYVCA